MKKLCLIDGSGFIFRAFHALPPLHTPDGTPVNAVFGFTKTLLSLIEDKSVDYIAVIFDSSRKTFRNDIYPEYKIHRPPAPEELIPQFPLFRQIVEALNIVSVEKEGFEADDIIATYARQAMEQNISTCIMSSDKDLMQLISDKHNIYMFDGIKKIQIKEQHVIEKFGVLPQYVTDAQSIIGDSADNVPGIKGIGVKGATELLQQYGTLEGIYENLENITKKAIKEKLIASEKLAFISKKLVTLDQNVECNIQIEDMIVKPIDANKLCAFLQKLSFNSLAQKIATKHNIDLCCTDNTNGILDLRNSNIPKPQISKKSIKTQVIDQIHDFENIIANLAKNRTLPIIININKVNILQNIYIFDELENIEYIINLENEEPNSLFEIKSFSVSKVLTFLKTILEDQAINKIVFNVKKLLHILQDHNISIVSYDDLVLMHYLLKGPINETSTAELIKVFESEYLISDIQEDKVNEQNFLPDNCASLCLDLYLKYKEQLMKQKLNHIYNYIDKPLAQSLYNIEKTGVLIDTKILNELSIYFSQHINQLEKEIYNLAGEEFNIGSPKQIGEILFNKLNVGGKKNKLGSWKTDANVLQELADNGIEIADKILSWRQLSKLKNTYSDKLINYVDVNGRIHCTYSQCLTTTARISSVSPNLQNIPIRTEEGRKIRQAFIAQKNYKLLSLDYSQIELRILAHIANVKNLKEAFINNLDIHTLTASDVFNIPFSEVNSDYRRKAKAINFGIIYGQTPFGLSKSLGISREEASYYIDQYFIKYPEIKNYMTETIEYAKKYGYVQTLYNRKCFIDNINQKNFQIKSLAERSAINAPIQGTGADIMREATNKVCRFLISNVNANVILQIHDELIIEVKKEDAEHLANEIKSIMESCASELNLKVDYKILNSWQ